MVIQRKRNWQDKCHFDLAEWNTFTCDTTWLEQAMWPPKGDKSLILFALLGDKVIGHLIGHGAFIELLEVLPKYRRLGAGKALVQEYHKRFGVCKERLLIVKDTAPFWAKMGYPVHETVALANHIYARPL